MTRIKRICTDFLIPISLCFDFGFTLIIFHEMENKFVSIRHIRVIRVQKMSPMSSNN
jgi:hypothetical protein